MISLFNPGKTVCFTYFHIFSFSPTNMLLCSLFCHVKLYILSQLLVLSLSLDNDAMATSKRCVKFFRLFLFLSV